MSVRHLDALFAPRSVAVVGVNARPGNIGALVLRKLKRGGFAGTVRAVDRARGEVEGTEVLAGVAALAEPPELAVVCTPAAAVPDVIAELGRLGTRAAIVLSSGLRQPSAERVATAEQRMLEAARPHLLRILGPNCIGLLVPGLGLDASFAPAQALPGSIAFVTQSGALATAMLDWANAQGIGFSHFVSMGDSADVDFGDVLDYLGSDGNTRAILMYMESVKHARKFMSAARAAARNKPVILVKAGRAPEGARAAASHTGALAGSDLVFDAAVRRAGLVRVDTLEALFSAAATLAHPTPWIGERLAILTNGGGAGVLAADALALGHGPLAALAPETLARLDTVLPAGWPRANPVDIGGDAPVERYRAALQLLLQAHEVDGVLFMHAPTAVVESLAIAEACTPLLKDARKPVLSCWLGGASVAPARKVFSAEGFPTHATPEQSVDAWLQLLQYHRHQAALLQLPDAQPAELRPARATAEDIVARARRDGREWLDEAQAKAVLQAYGIDTVPTRKARDAEEAVAAAHALGYPVALKVISPQILHKSDVGGVALNLATGEEVRAAAVRMRQRVARLSPQAQVSGFTVQPMAQRPRAHELIAGIATDPVFGPIVLFGSGGIEVELVQDRALALPPLNAVLARDLVARTRIGPRLAMGWRGRAVVNEPALLRALQQVAQIACDLPGVAELDINPLLADAEGVLALDARIRVRPEEEGDANRLALRPYPAELEETANLGGQQLLLRPIRPEDGERLAEFYAAATSNDLRLRFFLSRREVPLSELARYCQIDYEREMTFVAMAGDAIAGEVRAICDPDNEQAEFAIQVAGGWQRRGLGRVLMDKLVAYLRGRGTGEVVGQCLQENAGMAALARGAGFSVKAGPGDVLQLRLELAS